MNFITNEPDYHQYTSYKLKYCLEESLIMITTRTMKSNKIDNDKDDKQDSGLSCQLHTSPPLRAIG